MNEDEKQTADETEAKPAAAAEHAGEAAHEAPPPAPLTPEQRIAKLEAELAEANERVLRQLAETENIRRRAVREREDTLRYAAAGLAKDMLNVADNLRRALQAAPKEIDPEDESLKNFVLGVEMTEKELLAAFAKHGIRQIVPLGEKFDYDRHQAMFEIENTGKPAGTVVEVMQPGYIIHDRLLRPAMVGVARGEPQDPPEDTEHVDTTA